MNIDQYAVFGHPINHSKSPLIHKAFARQTSQNIDYTAQDVPADQFDTALDNFIQQGGKGLNCTVPLKELAFQRADKLSSRARLAKAVNTLIINNDGSISGDNTDGIGLVTDLIDNHQIQLHGRKILILGAGGASRGIIAPILDQKPDSLHIANRTISKAEQLADEFSEISPITSSGFKELAGLQFDLIINATSASLSAQLPPLPEHLLSAEGSCYDLAYANTDTAFVSWGKQQSAKKSIDGLGMLVEQAAEAFFLWRQQRPDTKIVIQQLDAERKNVSL